MSLPINKAYAVGEFTTWSKQFLDSLETANIFEMVYEPSVQKFCTLNPSPKPKIVFIENTPDSKQSVLRVRSQGIAAYMIWLGKSFTKEDFQFAEEQRVYYVFENPKPNDTKLFVKLQKMSATLDEKEAFSHVLHSFKTLLIQSENEMPKALTQEIKAAISKLDKKTLKNEFEGEGDVASGANQNDVPFHVSQTLSDAILTMHDLERTGVLWVQGNGPGQKGQIDFLQGKIVSANAGEVEGLKSIYRMYLWDNPRFLFNRKDPNASQVREHLDIPLSTLCREGEEYYRRFQTVRKQLPPLDLSIDLDPKMLSESLKLNWNEFSTLASVVEFKKVSQILNYNPLPDVVLLECLIKLRKENRLKVVV